jgi:signal transduction histidine kinase/CheY-like chemotaxis protein/HPt (histidine-containing phosphotransfer) domain-containing protein
VGVQKGRRVKRRGSPMLPIRTKVFVIIVAIVAAITVLSVGTGLLFVREHMLGAIANDMTVVGNIASKLASNRLELLKSEARTVAGHLRGVPEKEMPAVLEEEAHRYDYLSLGVYDADHRLIASYGDFLPAPQDMDNEYARRAFQDETVISTTERIEGGGVVLRVYAPAGERILVATLPGFVMSDLLSEFRIIQTGSLFILDATGVVLADTNPDRVRERHNFIDMARDDPNYREIAAIAQQMIQGKTGVGQYTHAGESRLCAHTQIPGSDHWSLGVVTPIAETSIVQTQRILLLSGVILLIMGVIVALFASGTIARPFQTIAAQNQSLLELERIAKNASETKSNFLANTSHEMRTPLNAIIGLSELTLDAGSLPEEAAANLEKIYDAGVTLLSIINDILDISKIESGKFELIPAEYDVPSMINDTRSMNIMRIADKPIQFQLLLDEMLPSRLIGDELRVKQIFNNLLSNAFKYTREGTVVWSVNFTREGDNVWLNSSIQDSGIGIKEEDIEKLFSDYNQVDTKSNRKIEGTGLGLSITKRMVEMMGGTISLSSVYGKGSTFTVRILQKFVTEVPIGPLVAQGLKGSRYTSGKRARNARLTRAHMPYAKVLVVDDVTTNLDVTKGIMKPYGMQVDCITSGIDAVRIVREEKIHYDAIFMDHMMPEMDGLEATRIIREEIGSEYAKTVPIIALTANALIGNEEMFLAHGFQAFLSKPIDVLRMDAVLKQWVRDKAKEQGTASAEFDTKADTETDTKADDEPTAAGIAIEGIDWQKALSRFGDDEETCLGVLRSYVLNTARLLDEIRDPKEENLANYAIIIHGIKGSSYSIEAKTVGQKAEALEHAAKAGDLGFVRANTPDFMAHIEKLLADLSALFSHEEETEKESKTAPDEDLLEKMQEAATNFRIDVMEDIMTELDRFDYAEESELITWLREQVSRMEFMDIRDRLAQRASRQKS